MKHNLIIRYKSKEQDCSANFCLNETQMELLKDCEVHGNYWPDLVLNRYAVNTSSALHRRRINSILDNRNNTDFKYEKIESKDKP